MGYFQDAEVRVDPLRDPFMKQLPSRLTWSHEERRQRKREYMDGKAPKKVSHFVDHAVRFVVAIAGGLFLVVPMVIMTIYPSTTKSLITVSIFVLLFALVLAFAAKVSNVETLISTATYAAVLVVFVGTTTGTNT
ncbi:hypothetical protein F4818DRAFT_404693 [Hypoxylon cercidicola]|nr:hypothetical protein F4818DRAFT_404693 [Hypoxylon cercidicola]